jgi:excisionase family DNA binding protein
MREIRLQVSNLLNYSEAARILAVTRATVYAMIERGELHPWDIADRRYLLREEVERIKKAKESIANA